MDKRDMHAIMVRILFALLVSGVAVLAQPFTFNDHAWLGLINTPTSTGGDGGSLTIVSIATNAGANTIVVSLTGVPAGALLVCSTAPDYDVAHGATNAVVTSSPALTWTTRVNYQEANQISLTIATAVYTAGGNIDVTTAWNSSYGLHTAATIYAVTGQESSLAGATNAGSLMSAPSLAITTTRSGSIIFGIVGDWAPADPPITMRDGAVLDFSHYIAATMRNDYFHKMTTTAGTYTEGESAPTAQNSVVALYELRSQ